MKKKILMVSVLIAMFLLGACSSRTVSADQNEPLQIWPQNNNGCYNTMYVVDKDTGVNYIVVSAQNYSNTITVTMTPRLNADGSLYVNK